MFRGAIRVLVEEATGVLEVLGPEKATTVSQPGRKVLPVHKLCFKGAEDKDAATMLLLRSDSLKAPSQPLVQASDDMGD